MRVALPTAQELRRIRRVLLREVPKAVADAFAMNTVPQFTRQERARMAVLVDRMLQTAVATAERLERAEAMAPRERAATVIGLMDKFVAALSPPWVPRQKRGIRFFTDQVRAMRRRPLSPELKGTGYRCYQSAIRKLVTRISSRGLLGSAYDVWNQMSQEQGIVQFQPLFRLGGDPVRSRRLRHVLIRRSRATVQDLQNLTETFRIFAGMYERHLRGLAAVVMLEHGRPIPTVKILQLPLARVMAIIEKDTDLVPIARRFDRGLRNAIAHDDIAVTPRLEKISVRDRGSTRTVGPQRLAKETREAAALVGALMEIPLVIFERTIFAANVMQGR